MAIQQRLNGRVVGLLERQKKKKRKKVWRLSGVAVTIHKYRRGNAGETFFFFNQDWSCLQDVQRSKSGRPVFRGESVEWLETRLLKATCRNKKDIYMQWTLWRDARRGLGLDRPCERARRSGRRETKQKSDPKLIKILTDNVHSEWRRTNRC